MQPIYGCIFMKKCISLIVATVMLVMQLGISVSAVETTPFEAEPENIEPRLSFSGVAYLGPYWGNILTDNNWLNATLTVTNHANNVGIVCLRVIDEDGNQIGRIMGVNPGLSVQMDTISHASGTYTLQGLVAENDAGSYFLTVRD